MLTSPFYTGWRIASSAQCANYHEDHQPFKGPSTPTCPQRLLLKLQPILITPPFSENFTFSVNPAVSSISDSLL